MAMDQLSKMGVMDVPVLDVKDPGYPNGVSVSNHKGMDEWFHWRNIVVVMMVTDQHHKSEED